MEEKRELEQDEVLEEVKEKETMETLSHTGSVAEACIRLV